MGTYTTNYNLFMPTVGEQGWGELVNGNFATIDTTMSGLNTRMGMAETNITSLTTRMGTAETTIASNKSRIGTLEAETDAIDTRVTVLEAGDFESVTSENIYGNVTGFLYIKAHFTGTSGDQLYGTCPQQTVTISSNYNAAGATALTLDNTYSSMTFGNPHKVSFGIYSRRSDVYGLTNVTQRTVTVQNLTANFRCNFYYRRVGDSSYTKLSYLSSGSTSTLTWEAGKAYEFYVRTVDSYSNENGKYTNSLSVTVAPVAGYVTYDTP